jgi:2-polyprenyl-6-methoxyphenol hydroxylase-like FAD-dependent oxidoreductase
LPPIGERAGQVIERTAMEGEMADRYQVVIVGAGPVGLALAAELGQRDIACAVIERHRTPVRIPKGQGLTNRTLEHFYFLGCVDELRAARVMPPGYPIGGITAYGNLMGDYWYRQFGGVARGAHVEDFYFQRNERLPQYCTEEVLRRRLTELPSVTTMFGLLVNRVEQDDRTARVTVVPANEGSFYSWSADTAVQVNRDARTEPAGAQTLEADYVIGCDGGRSLVRESLGIDRGGRSFDQRMVLAVLRSRELHQGLSRFPECTTYRVLKPELKGYWQFFGRIDVGEGFFFHAPVPRDTRPDNYDFQGLVREAAGFEFAAEFDHVGFWDLRVMVADRYRQGREFIAGDAAHQHPPYGGFGLNTGMEDVANLGWKLAARLQGWGGEALLDSYSEERRPIFAETGEVMIAGGIDRDRAFLERFNPERDRAEFARAWDAFGKQRDGPSSFEPHYEGSSAVMGPPDGVISIHGAYSHVAQPGHHLSPRTLSNGRNVFEELGRGFTLLAFDADLGAAAIEDTARSLNVPLKVVRDSFAGDRVQYARRLVLVRPDQYVVWAGDEAPADPAAILRRSAGLR